MNGVTKALHELFKRDLDKLINEVKAYEKEEHLWKVDGNISNSAGNLTLHIAGNLKHFIGAILGNSSYIRKRDEEFERKDVKRTELLEEIKETKKVVLATLEDLTENDLEALYPVNHLKKEMTTLFFLQHLYGHLHYHLGQINYHRRLLDQQK